MTNFGKYFCDHGFRISDFFHARGSPARTTNYYYNIKALFCGSFVPRILRPADDIPYGQLLIYKFMSSNILYVDRRSFSFVRPQPVDTRRHGKSALNILGAYII